MVTNKFSLLPLVVCGVIVLSLTASPCLADKKTDDLEDHISKLIGRADLYKNSGNYKEAISILTFTINTLVGGMMNPNSGISGVSTEKTMNLLLELYGKKGEVYSASGQGVEACRAFRTACAKKPVGKPYFICETKHKEWKSNLTKLQQKGLCEKIMRKK